MSDVDEADGPTLELSPSAVPLAGKKLIKKLHKVVKKAAASKILKRGVKEVVKALRKADKFKGCVCVRTCRRGEGDGEGGVVGRGALRETGRAGGSAWRGGGQRPLQRSARNSLAHTHTHP